MSGVLIIRKIGEILMLFVDLFLKLDYWMFSVTNHSLLYNFNINDLIIYWCGESVFANVLVNARRVSDEKEKNVSKLCTLMMISVQNSNLAIAIKPITLWLAII